MDYNEIAENIIENYTNTYCQADIERVAKVLKEISRRTAEEILNEFNNFLPNRASSNIENVRKALTVLAQAYHDKTQELAKQYGVEIKDNEN